ncbi:class I adenylate-forming enzyme family protein [Sphingomonas sp. LHG3443-2]|uniref:class I adenylate-forming enzyme family protein n=1 Tax=Sphingomonas sp. LHG3443-2 TaxID=2804639 RepID=UPI003CF41600
MRRGGDALALVDPLNREALDGRAPERLSWNEVAERTERLAAALLARGLRKDDIVVAQLPNMVDAVLLFLACARLGLIVSPVVMQYRVHELAFISAQTRPRLLVAVPNFAGFDHAAQGRKLGLEVALFGDGNGDLRSEMAEVDPATTATYVAENPTVGGEVLTICWTSGTESRPKGVPRDHNHWILNAHVVAQGTGMVPGDTLLNPFPLVNIGSIGGLVMPWLTLPARLVLHHPFDLGILLQQIEAEKVTYTIAPPAVLTALLKQPALMEKFDLSSLRAIGSGSAPLSPWLIEGWKARGIEICNIFGSNEGASLYSSAVDVPDTTDRSRYFPRFGVEGHGWSGLNHEALRTRLVDLETGEEIEEPGRPGELRLKGATLFGGYWHGPEITAAAFDEEGWFRTGDQFEIAGDGNLKRFYRFVGRSKEIIVRGGVNISPAELDDLLAGLPGSREAATVGIPDADLGERVAVGIVPTEGANLSIAEVSAFLKERGVAVFKLPERLVTLDRLPRNAMNKVVRSELREAVLAKL